MAGYTLTEDASKKISSFVDNCAQSTINLYAYLILVQSTYYVGMILYGKKIDSKYANSPSDFSDSSTVCLPEDADVKPFDEPQMHCYQLGR